MPNPASQNPAQFGRGLNILDMQVSPANHSAFALLLHSGQPLGGHAVTQVHLRNFAVKSSCQSLRLVRGSINVSRARFCAQLRSEYTQLASESEYITVLFCPTMTILVLSPPANRNE